MKIAIGGAHGKIALRLVRLLTARGDEVVGLIRNPDHADDVRAAGAEPAVCDLEKADVAEVAAAVRGADAVVFAAGAGAGSGPERKWTMDRDGAIKLRQASPGHYVMISSVGAQDPPQGDDVFSVYLRAKAEADQAVMAGDGDWTIVRPGRLTDEPGTGRLRVDEEPFRGEVARDDVAALLAEVLHEPRAAGHVLYVNGGDDAIESVLRSLSAPG